MLYRRPRCDYENQALRLAVFLPAEDFGDLVMIYCQSLGFVFVHIPKNAGSSIENLLHPLLTSDADVHITRGQLRPPSLRKAGFWRFVPLGKHAKVQHIRWAMGPRRYDRQFSFAFCRNPYARAYSCHAFIKAKVAMIDRLKSDPGSQREIPRSNSNLRAIAAKTFDEVCQDLRTVSRRLGLFRPQVSWLPKEDSVDFVGRVENFAHDMSEILGKIGRPAAMPPTPPVLNRKTEPDEWRSMSTRSAAATRDYYAADFVRFGYSAELTTA